ncbi:hypothetical protein D8B29_04695 [Verminephrobacter eiseniae]|nr:hypothetical protein [Verminephrobacter eiseniae]MCW5305115.1 hypothetical protein [Verminephrobacter eiseniae]MCW8178947.1 hypothetical protein [Verminephrobacter eiseniae]
MRPVEVSTSAPLAAPFHWSLPFAAPGWNLPPAAPQWSPSAAAPVGPVGPAASGAAMECGVACGDSVACRQRPGKAGCMAFLARAAGVTRSVMEIPDVRSARR